MTAKRRPKALRASGLYHIGCSLFRVGSAHCACRLLQSVDPALQTLTHRTISHSLVSLNAITQLLDDHCILFHLCSSLCSARCRTVSLFLFSNTNLRILGQTHPTHKTLKEEISHFFRIQTVALPSRVDNKAPCKFAGFQNNFLHLR